jgi:drug/metabolite transporter (DMT)-like permease
MVLSLLIAGTLGFNTFCQMMIKARALAHGDAFEGGKPCYLAAMFSDPLTWSAIGAAVAAAICWILAVQQAPLSFVYPFMALNFLFVPVLSLGVFGERMRWRQAVGVALIVVGVAVNGIASQR